MREIKFRAWSKKHNEFLVIDGDLLLCWEGYTGWYVWKNGYGEYLKQSEIELSQFTGLKDKNGKEIYEGDILRRSFPHGNYHIYIVKIGEYQDYDGEYYPTATGIYIEEHTNGEDRQSNFFRDMADAMEIIGNIYENPELLK